MRTLLGEEYAPITSSIGFLEMPFAEAVERLEGWRNGLNPGRVRTTDLTDTGFPAALRKLEPLTGVVAPRELLVGHGGWTAYFDCSVRGTDAASPIGHLSRVAHCRGLIVDTVPHTVGLPGIAKGRLGAVQWQLFGPSGNHFLNYVRTMGLVHDGSHWEFGATGLQQPYEEPEAYRSRKIQDRLSSAMVERYSRALGVDVFDPAAYGPDCALIETDVQPPPDALVLSLREAQAWLEITPGAAEALPG